MKNKKLKRLLLSVVLFIFFIGLVYLLNINNFKRDGQFEISVNNESITIHRDENGIAYIFAQNKADAIRGQGFVTAQDRLFQIEFYRALIKGELASIIGESMLQSDIKMRVLNLKQSGEDSWSYLDEATKKFLNWYCEGFNEYLRVAKDEFPVELNLLHLKPKVLNPEELVAIIHFIGLNHARNMDDEILHLNLAARTHLAYELQSLNINPDRIKPLTFQVDSLALNFSKKLSKKPLAINPTLLPEPKFGSNNWAVSGSKSASGSPIISNDPHLDARLLPGIFYPVGLFCPSFKSVGLALPGMPGLIIGRNEHVAFGITNGYGDSQDLYIEKTEGDFYDHEGQKRVFKKRKETIYVKDGASVEIEIRSTDRGSVISDFDVFGIMTKDVVSLRWSQKESKSTSLGIEQFLEAKDIFEFREALADIDNMFFNFVVGDTKGNIAHQATGLVPKRKGNAGKIAQVYNQLDSWDGFIPKDQLPHTINPKKGWVGTANHDTRPDDYPYYYSAHFSPNYRYLRMKEVLSTDKKIDAEDCWNLILDCKNKQAERINPIFVEALQKKESTKNLAVILESWNHNDNINEVGSAIYNVLYNELLNLILDDELPDEIEESFWKNSYYWTQRIDSFMLSNHKFIDNIETKEVESLDDLIIEAGEKTKKILTERIGNDMGEWTWGAIHTIKFASPIRREGLGSSLLGAEEMPKRGSNQTINRGGYIKEKESNFETYWLSTFRMVADLNDSEKIRGVLAGGSTARILHPYYTSQLEAWKKEQWIPYWISREKILAHSKHQLILN